MAVVVECGQIGRSADQQVAAGVTLSLSVLSWLRGCAEGGISGRFSPGVHTENPGNTHDGGGGQMRTGRPDGDLHIAFVC